MGFSVHLQHRVLAFGQYNFLGARLPVPSSLNLPLWRSKPRGYDDYAACDFLEFGWPVGLNYASSLSTDQFSRNHKGATDFPSAVDSYLSLELERGAVIGPFSSNPFSRPIVISPLNSVPKPQSFERQMILNLNRSIDPFDYPLLGYQWNGDFYFCLLLWHVNVPLLLYVICSHRMDALWSITSMILLAFLRPTKPSVTMIPLVYFYVI